MLGFNKILFAEEVEEAAQNVKENVSIDWQKVIDTIVNSGNIKKIVLNGAKAANLFDKYFNIQGIEILKMPSTSPANAAYSAERLVNSWKEIL